MPTFVFLCRLKVQISLRSALKRGFFSGGSFFLNLSNRSSVETSFSPSDCASLAMKLRISKRRDTCQFLFSHSEEDPMDQKPIRDEKFHVGKHLQPTDLIHFYLS